MQMIDIRTLLPVGKYDGEDEPTVGSLWEDAEGRFWEIDTVTATRVFVFLFVA